MQLLDCMHVVKTKTSSVHLLPSKNVWTVPGKNRVFFIFSLNLSRGTMGIVRHGLNEDLKRFDLYYRS